MRKLLLSASVGILALVTSGASNAQTWQLSPEQAQKWGSGAAPAAPSAPAATAPAAAPVAAASNDELLTLSKDPKQWVSPTGDYYN
ncbi:MAG: hypothetical protein ACR652_14740, partial [Methylocystis sp.]|uniref:hypothetical protein n=1 Tax=Methylocystis sp. TaxID=1911079 RepID=UPI003DA2ED57